MGDTEMSTDVSSVLPEEPQEMAGFIDMATFEYLNVIMRVVLTPAAGAFALFTGIVNIATFAKMELRQGVNLSLLILSASDFVLALIANGVVVTYIMLWLRYRIVYGVRVDLVLRSFRWFLTGPMNVSLITTTVIAVIRCLFVLFPLSSRTMLTVRHQIGAIAVCSALSISVPVYYTRLYISLFLGASGENETSSSSKLNPDNRVLAVFDIFRNVLFFTCLCIILFSMVFLRLAVKRSPLYRARAPALTTSAGRQVRPISVREARMVKTVVLILLVFVTCNMPLMLLSVLRLWSQEFARTRQFKVEKDVLEMFVGLGIILNAGLNTPVYLCCNTQFKQKAMAIFYLRRVQKLS